MKKKQKLTRSSLLLAVAALALSTSTSAMAQDSTEPEKRGDAICGVWGVTSMSFGTPELDFQELYDEAAPEARCWLVGKPESTEFRCTCDKDSDEISGSLPGLDFSWDPGANPENHIRYRLPSLCQETLNERCGPFPEDKAHTCVSPKGAQCDIEASGTQKGDRYSEFWRVCYCENGDAWAQEAELVDGVSVDEPALVRMCQAGLEACDPTPTQAPESLFPDDIIQAQSFACGVGVDVDDEGDEPETACIISPEDGATVVECQCGEEEFSFTMANVQAPGYDELVSTCETQLKRCVDMLPKPEPEPEPSLEDILEALGCSMQRAPLPEPLMALGALGLLALRRRRR